MADVATAAAPTTAPASAQPQAGESTAKTPATEAAAAAPKMFKLKVDGQDLELTESEVIKLAQQGKSADKRFQEAAMTRKEAEELIKYAQDNPKEFFKRTGKNARQWAEEYLLEEIQREAMTPEQKRAWENEQELKRYRDTEKAEKARAEQERMAQLEQHHMKSYDQMFVQALTESGLPRTPYTIKRMAELTLVNVKKKLDLEPSQLAKIVREDYIAEQRALYGSADGESLLELLGKDAVTKVSKAQLAKYKSSKVNGGKAPPKPSEQREQKHNPVSAWKQMQKKTRSLL